MMVRYIFSTPFALILLSISFSASQASILCEWNYSKASDAIAKGDYVHAQDLMRTLLVDEPTRPDLLYDLGVTSFKNKEYEQAGAYFNSAAAAEACPPQLAEQALFNLGNSCVELKQLNDAIIHYQKVLELNEKNEYARHNLEVVKKMLDDQEQQKQNQDDQKDQDQNKDDKKDQKDQQKNKDQNQSGDKQKNKDDSSKGDDGNENEQDSSDKNEKDKSGKSDQDKKDNSKKDQKDNDKNDQNNPDDSKNKEKGNSNQKDEKQKDKSSEQPSSAKDSKDADAQKLEQKVKDDVQKNVDAEGNKGNEKKNMEASKGADAELDLAPEDKWILQVLDRRENDEKKTNKELMRATIDQKLAGQDGKNCW